MLPSGFVKESDYFCDCFCRVPPSWTDGADVTEAARDKLFETLYGEKWKEGNSDGSRYVVRSLNWKVCTPDKAKNFPWNAVVDNNESHFFFFIADDREKLQKVSKERFVSDINASTPSNVAANTTIDSPPPSNLENVGLSNSPEGEPDLRIKISKTGNVKFGTSLVPLYSALAPLLVNDYQGSGEFEKRFDSASEGVRNFKESFVANAHGNYFRMQTFQFVVPNSDWMTIASNQLRHIQTGATLLVSFTLVNMGRISSLVFLKFEGNNIEVQKLLEAIAPALEAAGFVDDQAKNNSPAQSAAVDKNAVDYIDWFRSGTLKSETTFKPFFHALKPLLADYTGAGEYKFAFAGGIDEPGMKDLFEDVTSNAHGAYLKYRSCICERGGKTEDLQVIGSNLLTHTRTGEKLRVQLTLRKDLNAGTAKLTIVLLGPEAEVEKLNAAIQPALDESDFTVQLKLKKPPSPESAEELVR